MSSRCLPLSVECPPPRCSKCWKCGGNAWPPAWKGGREVGGGWRAGPPRHLASGSSNPFRALGGCTRVPAANDWNRPVDEASSPFATSAADLRKALEKRLPWQGAQGQIASEFGRLPSGIGSRPKQESEAAPRKERASSWSYGARSQWSVGPSCAARRSVASRLPVPALVFICQVKFRAVH